MERGVWTAPPAAAPSSHGPSFNMNPNGSDLWALITRSTPECKVADQRVRFEMALTDGEWPTAPATSGSWARSERCTAAGLKHLFGRRIAEASVEEASPPDTATTRVFTGHRRARASPPRRAVYSTRGSDGSGRCDERRVVKKLLFRPACVALRLTGSRGFAKGPQGRRDRGHGTLTRCPGRPRLGPLRPCCSWPSPRPVARRLRRLGRPGIKLGVGVKFDPTLRRHDADDARFDRGAAASAHRRRHHRLHQRVHHGVRRRRHLHDQDGWHGSRAPDRRPRLGGASPPGRPTGSASSTTRGAASLSPTTSGS